MTHSQIISVLEKMIDQTDNKPFATIYIDNDDIKALQYCLDLLKSKTNLTKGVRDETKI